MANFLPIFSEDLGLKPPFVSPRLCFPNGTVSLLFLPTVSLLVLSVFFCFFPFSSVSFGILPFFPFFFRFFCFLPFFRYIFRKKGETQFGRPPLRNPDQKNPPGKSPTYFREFLRGNN